jgi:ABC-type glutathione transport system ATPase component
MAADQRVLDIVNLDVHYFTPRGAVIAANDINLYVKQGEIVGLVGESGCGKTTVAMAILRMVQPPGRIVNGGIYINGKDIVHLQEREPVVFDSPGGDELPEPGYQDQRANGRCHPGTPKDQPH